MRVAPDSAGRLVRVSLREVPLEQRRAAARPPIDQAARVGGWSGLKQAIALTHAYLRPSDRVYLVPEAQAREVLGSPPASVGRP